MVDAVLPRLSLDSSSINMPTATIDTAPATPAEPPAAPATVAESTVLSDDALTSTSWLAETTASSPM